MYRVILVDDEPWEVRGLEKVFKWKENGFEIAGRYTDPVIALEAICSTKCDLVITDIRMPEISGIDLIRRVRKAGIDTEFIIISGFAEFSYAQEAIREGALDYWLKPVMIDEADELLARLVKKLEEKRNTADFKLIEQIMEEDADGLAVLPDSMANPDGRCFQTVLLELPQEHTEIVRSFRSVFNESRLELCWGARKRLFLFSTDACLLEEIRKWHRQCNRSQDIYAGVSRTGSGIRNIRLLINESIAAAKNHFIYNCGGVYSYREVNRAAVNGIMRLVEEMLRHNCIEKLVQAVRCIPEQFVSEKLSIKDFFYFWSRISVVFSNSPLLCKRETEYDVDDAERIILEFKALSTFCSYLSEFLLAACGKAVDGQPHKQDSDEIMVDIVKYIDSNYNRDISLKEVAGRFFLHSSYCSELFKKFTGQTFSDYVRDIRMKKASELFRSPTSTISDVCQMVGYNDYYYFIKVFKKYHGITPAKFIAKCR